MLRRGQGIGAGFTFVELMCASAVFLFGLSAVLSLDRASAAEAARAAHRSRAQALLFEVVSLYSVLPLTTVASMKTPISEAFDVGGAAVSAGTGFFTVVSNAATNARNGLDVQVQVSWTEPDNTTPPPLRAQRTLPAP